MNFSFGFKVSLACALACGCSSSSNKAGQDGGAAKDATADSHHHVTLDAGMTAQMDANVPDVNLCGSGDLNDAGTPVFALEAGTTWRDLYRDYFGPSGVASCQGNGHCHGSTAEQGFMASAYLCPATDGGEACWRGMTLQDGGPNLVGSVPFDGGGLGSILCQSYCVGLMPLPSSSTSTAPCGYYFTPTDMERIHDWVAAGATDSIGDAGADHAGKDAAHEQDAARDAHGKDADHEEDTGSHHHELDGGADH